VARPTAKKWRAPVSRGRVPGRSATASRAAVDSVLALAVQVRTQKFLKLLAAASAHRKRNTVHDLRVAIRRLIAALDLVRPAVADATVERTRRRLRRLLRSLGPLRDLEIERLLLSHLVHQHPALRSVLRRKTVQERQLLATSVRHVRAFDRLQFEQSVAGLLVNLETLGRSRPGQAGLLAAVRSVRARAFLAVLRARARTDRGSLRSIHALRVAMKKFRYATEILAPFEPGVSPALLKAMNALQVTLGEVQDWSVVLEALTRRGGQRLAMIPGALVGILQTASQRRGECIDSALRSLHEIPSYWDGRE
jgi:triphosphatase